MRDISKRLTVINTEKKDNASDSKGQSSGVTYVGLGGGGMKNLNDYLLKSIWDRVWEIRTDSQGTEYIFGKLPVVTQYGITMYSGENTDIPTIAEGLPFDKKTIWFNPTTKQIEVIGGIGGGSGEGVSNFWDLSGIPSWITNTKPTYSHSEIQGTPDLSVYALVSQIPSLEGYAKLTDIPSLSGYATEQWVLGKGYALNSDLTALSNKVTDFLEGSDTDNIINKWKELESFLNGLSESDNLATILGAKADKSYVDSTFVTINGTEDVTGLHDFTNGLKIGGMKLFKSQDDVVYLDGNLVVTGGVTMYGDENADIPTIYDGLPIDNVTIYWENTSNGKVLKAKVGTEGAITEITSAMVISALGFTPYDASNPNGYITSSALNGYATQTWVKNQGYLTSHQDLSGYQPLITSTNKLAYSLISGTPILAAVATSGKYSDLSGLPTIPTSLKNPNALSFGSKSYDGSEKIILTASDLGALTSHQAIYTLTFQSGTFASGSFTANSANKTINIPTTTSHISEGSNLYFTNARAVSALADTLKAYVTLSGTQTITGEKNFTGGLKVNGSPIYYDTEKKYWKLEGDLLVTGGVTMYGNDSDFVASTIMDAIRYDDSTLGINAQGQLYVKGSVGGATTLGSLTNVGSWADSVASQDRIMYQAANSSKWVAKNLSDLTVGGVTGDYLPLNMTSTPFVVNTQSGVVNFKSTSASEVGFRLYFGDSNKGGLWADNERIYLYHAPTGNSVGLTTGGRLIFKSGDVDYTVLHSENYDNYALPLSGGTITGTLAIINKDVSLCLYRQQNNATPYIRFAKNTTTQYGELGVYNDGRLVFWPLVSSQGGYGKWNTVWHSGNDGSGSGLDADLLDGKHYLDIINGNVASATRIQAYQHNSGENVLISGSRTDNTFPRYIYDNGWGLCLRWQEGNGVVHNGTIATLNDNVASATKLATPRTIWGQSFDGTGDIEGAFRLIFPNIPGDGHVIHSVLKYKENPYGLLTRIYNDGAVSLQVQRESNVNEVFPLLLNPNGGNVGIGTTSPSQKLHVAGNILITGGVTMYSARKLKIIQDERGLSLEELSIIKPTRFTWKDGRDNKIHIGGIADDVMKVLPEVIYKTGEDDTLTMDYGNAAFAIAASLIKPVISHEERIKVLEEENKRLKEEVEQLKWNIA